MGEHMCNAECLDSRTTWGLLQCYVGLPSHVARHGHHTLFPLGRNLAIVCLGVTMFIAHTSLSKLVGVKLLY